MRVIGTAGHVDHGKSTLVHALTGIHPDRLKEEREREMTIDLGFAWFDLPNGEPVGVVDVPGHRDFIENMLAGVGGIDAVLLVIAADEGVMPQTREHLAILDVLQVQAGVVALTKADRVDDDWLNLMHDEVAVLLGAMGALARAPIIPVSARTGRGLPELRQALQEALTQAPRRPNLGRPRLSIDRSFSQTGFGTIVTGTLLDGTLQVGDTLRVQPRGLTARVRGLQTHKIQQTMVFPGSRVAVNLAGVEVADVHRGDVLAWPGSLTPSRLLDVWLRHLPDDPLPMRHNAEVKLFIGAAETLAHVRLLEGDDMPPGAVAWAQMVCAHPVAALPGDRFIIRRPSPSATIGGGRVVAVPTHLHRRRRPDVLAALEQARRGSPLDNLVVTLTPHGIQPLAEVARRFPAEVLTAARVSGQWLEVDASLGLTAPAWHTWSAAVTATLETYHRAHPLQLWMPRDSLKNLPGVPWASALTPKALAALLQRLAAQGVVVVHGTGVRLASHAITFSPAEQAQLETVLAEFRAAPYATPSYKMCAERLGQAVLNAALETGQLIAVSPDVLFLPETYAEMRARLAAHITAHGPITVAEARDLFGTSRKYNLALLEHLDQAGFTRRVGDARVLKA